ncbi:MAG: hypothetical protein R3D59_16195 [Paracoccaceae bacterium]
MIDLSNPVTADFFGLQVPAETSAAEETAALLPVPRWSKAFNTIFAQHYTSGLAINGQPLRPSSRPTTRWRASGSKLAGEIGLVAVDAGPLRNAATSNRSAT